MRGIEQTTAPGKREPKQGRQAKPKMVTMPLQQPRPWSSGQPVSREGLALKRDEFWTTRVTGREEIWGAIKLASELLINNDVDMANQILLAAEVTTPQGTLAVCYDRLGNKYEVEPTTVTLSSSKAT